MRWKRVPFRWVRVASSSRGNLTPPDSTAQSEAPACDEYGYDSARRHRPSVLNVDDHEAGSYLVVAFAAAYRRSVRNDENAETSWRDGQEGQKMIEESRKSYDHIVRENAELRARLEEAQDALQAIRTGGVDGLVIEGPKGIGSTRLRAPTTPIASSWKA